MPKIADVERDADGKLPAYAWPGGYAIYYIDNDNSALCPDCASGDQWPFRLVGSGIVEGDDTMTCEQCSADIN